MDLNGQWADALLARESLHLAWLLVWALLSIVVGTALIAYVRWRDITSPLITHFAIQTIAWGAIDAIISLSARYGLEERDLAGAVSLDRFVWLNIGLDVGYVGIGLTLAICGWQLGRRMGLVGAGCGIMVQGLALTLLDLALSRHILR